MKRIAILLLLIAFLILAGGVLAKSTDSGFVRVNQLTENVLTGGEYRITQSLLKEFDSIHGGDYVLFSQSAPIENGSGCCCTYLPCIINAP